MRIANSSEVMSDTQLVLELKCRRVIVNNDAQKF